MSWLLTLPWPAIIAESKDTNVDELLIAAMVQVESAGDPCAARYEPHFRWTKDVHAWAHHFNITHQTEETLQKTSFGLMQIMGATYRDLGGNKHILSLCEPRVGLRYGIKYLRKQLMRYDWDIEKAVAAYNAGSVRYRKCGVLFENQQYVDKVFRKYREAKKAKEIFQSEFQN